MREYYAAPFQMTFTQGGAKSYMASYNAWNGIPMTVHPILRDVVYKNERKIGLSLLIFLRLSMYQMS
jgi:beta-glucosidase-like glycosyl hydrolase